MDNENKNLNPRDKNEPIEQTREKEIPKASTSGQNSSEEEFYIDGDANKKDDKPKYTPTTNTFITGMIKAAVYITCIVIVSVFLAIGIIVVGNDVFALVKDDKVIEITVTDTTTVNELADILYENEIIKYPSVFKLFASMKDMTDEDIVGGTYKISPAMNYEKLTASFKPIFERKIIRLTIPEGSNVLDIIKIFTDNGIGTYDGFVSAINDFDYSEEFEWLKPLYEETDSKRYFRLEGYLYPNTYDFYTDSKETQIIYKLLEEFDAKFSEEMKNDAEEAGYSIDEIIKIASLIQKEAYFYEDYDKISSVFHNRLKNKKAFPKLESDATVTYAIEVEEGRYPEELGAAELNFDSPYNTRKYDGMPPSAIANPGYEAIMCALYPANTDYYYFVADAKGNNVFSKTYQQHLEAVEAIRNAKEED